MQNWLIIATYRTNNKLSQQDMAHILHISLSTYKLYEQGTIPMKIEELNTLSNYFNISLDYLLNMSNKPYTTNFRRSIDYKYLRFCLRFLRRKYRVTQKSLAKEFKVSVYTISKYEKKAENVSIDYLYLFAKKFHISIDYLCGKSLKKDIL